MFNFYSDVNYTFQAGSMQICCNSLGLKTADTSMQYSCHYPDKYTKCNVHQVSQSSLNAQCVGGILSGFQCREVKGDLVCTVSACVKFPW